MHTSKRFDILKIFGMHFHGDGTKRPVYVSIGIHGDAVAGAWSSKKSLCTAVCTHAIRGVLQQADGQDGQGLDRT
jgi:hypothetical protein